TDSAPAEVCVQVWFACPLQVLICCWVPPVVVEFGSSRHLPAPTACSAPVLPVLPPLTAHVELVAPVAPVESVALMTGLKVPPAVGVPEIRPEAEIDRPGGRPVAEKVSVCPLAESLAWTCTEVTGVPTAPLWLPRLVTVTTLPLVLVLP